MVNGCSRRGAGWSMDCAQFGFAGPGWLNGLHDVVRARLRYRLRSTTWTSTATTASSARSGPPYQSCAAP